MCGRFAKFGGYEKIREALNVIGEPSGPRYNVAPGTDCDVIRQETDGSRRIVMLRWGLVPAWGKDGKAGFKAINARAESVGEKPAFRDAFKKRRCLIPMDGFYEWEKTAGGKRPHFIHLRNGAPMAAAGLWERWDRGETPLESFTIITCAANELLRPLHDRMPVILPAACWERWLDPSFQDAALLAATLVPFDPSAMEEYAVSPRVNKAGEEGPELTSRSTPVIVSPLHGAGEKS